MSTLKHTPGPWIYKFSRGAGLSVHADVQKALGERYSSDCPIYHIGTDACGMQIAYELWTQFPRQAWEDMQAANARLIASAPELLDACEEALSALNGAEVSLPDYVVKKLEFAIAKATGEKA